MDYQVIIIIFVVIVAMITIAILFPLKCPSCQTKLKHELNTDTFGINITKNLILTPRSGGSNSYYSCPNCSKLFKQSGSKLEEVKKIPARMVLFN